MDEIRRAWQTFRIEAEVARTYPQAIAIRGMLGGVPAHLPWLDTLLPSLLFIRAMEIHDDALDLEISRRVERLPKKYAATLNGRLAYCSEHWPEFDGERLKPLGLRRNELAHESDQHSHWTELGPAIDVIEQSLLALGALPERYVVFVEYERPSDRQRPEKGGASFQFNYNCRISINGRLAKVWHMIEYHQART